MFAFAVVVGPGSVPSEHAVDLVLAHTKRFDRDDVAAARVDHHHLLALLASTVDRPCGVVGAKAAPFELNLPAIGGDALGDPAGTALERARIDRTARALAAVDIEFGVGK